MIKFFPWHFVPLSINIRINVSKIRSSECAFSNYFNKRFICTNSIYKTPLSSNTELFSLLRASFILIPPQNTSKINTFYIQYCNIFYFISSHQNIMTFIRNMWFKFKSNIFKISIMTKHKLFWWTYFINVNSFWNISSLVL